MSKTIPADVIEKTLKGLTIPSRPKVLLQIEGELRKDDPDPRIVARLIDADAGLTAAILKTVNSPFFGLAKRTSSIAQAVAMVGMRTATQIVTGLILRKAVAGQGSFLEEFWDRAEQVAAIASRIAQTIPRGPRDDAYCFALFHDVGIPILTEKFPDYPRTLLLAENTSDRPFAAVERERHATDHATLGYLVAKGWFLPEAICEGILYHHDPAAFTDREAVSPRAQTLIAINVLAECFHDENIRLRDNFAWERMGREVLRHLGLTEGEYCDLREDLTAMFS
ncbi:MAG: HDOD domain-containing protein [Candidatus Accumulibacter sp.]|uniref:HDOD domain-containing protein n=1 Tax=Accumulibacter sp. TaxID=2053492 RepID=UPI001AD334F4|nr:HDOD domain-containing protein [Accumulibacter sp.]MBN8439354.1 HDOD domain-containing protein [Accumulibacter sp.]